MSTTLAQSTISISNNDLEENGAVLTSPSCEIMFKWNTIDVAKKS